MIDLTTEEKIEALENIADRLNELYGDVAQASNVVHSLIYGLNKNRDVKGELRYAAKLLYSQGIIPQAVKLGILNKIEEVHKHEN